MVENSRRWTVRDRAGNEIYLSLERWAHISDPLNHPEMLDFEEELKETLRVGRRKQDVLNPQKYRYSLPFHKLVEDNTHVVVIVLCRFAEDLDAKPTPNNFVVTAYLKQVW
jgi:hypothetical protein